MLRVLFFGTSSFAARICQFLLQNQVEIVAVVTRPDRPRGRNLESSFSPVKEFCLKHAASIPVHQPEVVSTPESIAELKKYQADLFLVVAYGEIIKQELLDVPKLGCINIHGSLLPLYRGAAPIQRALMDGVSETGITIIAMNSKMDAGDILKMGKIPVPLEMTYGELEPLLCDLGGRLALETVHDMERGICNKIAQDHTLATRALKITPQDEIINWKQGALQIHNQIRALSPRPGAATTVLLQGSKRRLKILRSYPLVDQTGGPGELLKFSKEEWVVGCGQGALSILRVQLEGKKEMPARDFFVGLQKGHALQFFS